MYTVHVYWKVYLFTHTSVYRFEDAGHYYWLLAKSCLGLARRESLGLSTVSGVCRTEYDLCININVHTLLVAVHTSVRLWMRDLFIWCTCVHMYMSITIRNVIYWHARAQLGRPHRKCIDLGRGPHCTCIFLVRVYMCLAMCLCSSDPNGSTLVTEEQRSKFRYYLDLSENYHVYNTVHQFIVRPPSHTVYPPCVHSETLLPSYTVYPPCVHSETSFTHCVPSMCS